MDNDKQDDDETEFYTTIEPVISYCSSSNNCGVSTLLSSRDKKPKRILDMSFTPIPSSFCDSFSLNNTIMLPYITTEESMDISHNDNNNRNNNNNLIDIENNREKEKLHNSFIRDNTSYNTLSSRADNKENEEFNFNNLMYEKKI